METLFRIRNSETLFTVTYMQLYKALSSYNILLKPGEFYHLHPQLTNPITSAAWPEKIPGAGNEGMYFLFDAYEHLIFIGYALDGLTIQDHLGVIFSVNPIDGSCVVNGDAWPTIPYYVVTLPLDKKLCLESALIREFLISIFPDMPNVRFNIKEEQTLNTHRRKTYPLWQYLLAVVSVPFVVIAAIYVIIIIQVIIYRIF